LQQAGVAGIIRGQILKQAQTCGFDIKIDNYPLIALERAEEVFLSNSLLGIGSVKQFNTANIVQWSNTTAAQCLRQHLIQKKLIAP
jgi:4-amino-4-deoxychorismate lyase